MTSQRADEASARAAAEKSMQRSQYYIYEKGGEGTPFEKFDRGQLSHLSKYELNELMKNPDFDKNYAFVTASDYFDIMKGQAKGTDLGNPYGKETKISLLGGDIDEVPQMYIVDGQRPDGNYKGQRKRFSYLQSDDKSIILNFQNEQKSILKAQREMADLVKNVGEGTSIPKQVISSVVTFGRNLGFDIGEGPTNIKQAQMFLKRIQAREAKNILQEVGKTLSDTDRQIVKDIVGDINYSEADPELILMKLNNIYDLIVTKRQTNLDTAISNLSDQFGITFNFDGDSANKPGTEEELAELKKIKGIN